MATLHQPRGTGSTNAFRSVLRILLVGFGFFLVAHGIIHLMGFLVQWKLATIEGLDYRTTILGGHIDLGASGIKIEGLLWLPPIAGFVLSALGMVLGAPWWRRALLLTTAFSLVVCALGWPQARVGLYVNVGILVILALLTLLYHPSPKESEV